MSGEPPEHSPSGTPDRDDPGDETQRNFRYQHAYGVILLLGSARGALEYVSIWCEHHEDYLAERRDGFYDAYQIKTAKPEDGSWTWTADGLRDSIKRFVRLHRKFPARIARFRFVSNVTWLDSHAVREAHRSPPRLLAALGTDLSDGPKRAFDDLRAYCECDALDLRFVLERLDFIKGPGRDSFEDEIAHSIRPAIGPPLMVPMHPILHSAPNAYRSHRSVK